MENPDTILFDLGHTLIDFRPAKEQMEAVYAEVHRRIAAFQRGPMPSVEELAELLPRTINEIIDGSYLTANAIEELHMPDVLLQAFSAVGLVLPERLLDDIVLLEHASLSSSMVMADGVAVVLAELKDRGWKIGLVSNATNLPHLLRNDLKRLGILEYFDATTFSSELGLRKPHPRIYYDALNAAGASPERTVFVGDRIREDIRGPQALGMQAVLTRQFRQEDPDSAHPDAVITDIKEMLDFVQQIGV